MHSIPHVVQEFARQLGVRQLPEASHGSLQLALAPRGLIGFESVTFRPEQVLLVYAARPIGGLPGPLVRHALAWGHAMRASPLWIQLGLRRMDDEFHLLALVRLPALELSLSELSNATDFLWRWLDDVLSSGEFGV